MKNTFFLQGETQGATVVKINDIIGNAEALEGMSYEEAVALVGSNEVVMELVFSALDDGEVYGFTHKSKKVKALVCDILDSLLESEINLFVQTLVSESSLARLNNTRMSEPCKKAVKGLYEDAMELADPAKGQARVEAGIEARRQAEENEFNKFQNKEENVQMTTINGLTIGGAATSKVGVGIVKGFEGANNEIVLLEIAGQERKVFAATVIPGVHQVEVKQADPAAAAQVAAWEQEARDVVNGVVANMANMSEQEIFEMKENARLAQQEQWKANRNKEAAAAAKGGAASRILAMGAALLGNQAPAAAPAAPAPQAQAPANGPVVPGVSKNVLQQAMDRTRNNQTQNNGGNVQMTNNTTTRGAVDRPEAGVAGGTTARINRNQAPAQKPATEVSTGRGTNAGASTRRPSGNAGTPVSTGRGGSTRIGQGAATPVATRKGLALKAEAPIVNNYVSQAWYMSDRFENVISGEAFEDVRKNEALGISHAIFWTPEGYNARFNRDAQESELAVLQVFVGNVETDEYGYATAGISIEFRLRYSNNPDAKSPWYCNNITFVENKKGNGGRWHYTVGKRADRYAVTVDANYTVSMASEDDLKNHKDAVQYVGSNEWKNERIFGLDVSEALIAQVMRWAAYGWNCMNSAE